MFAIQKLSTLLGVESNDSLSSEPKPDEANATSKADEADSISRGIEGEDEDESEVTKAREPDDDSTVAISESSSFGSPTKSEFSLPTTDDESKASVGRESGERHSPLKLSDVGESEVSEVKVNCHDSDGKAKIARERFDIVSVFESEPKAHIEDIEDTEGCLASAIDSSGGSSLFGPDAEDARGCSLKSEKNGDQDCDTSTKISEGMDCPLKKETALKVEATKDKEKQDSVEESVVIVKVEEKAKSTETKSEEDQIEGQTELGLVVEEQPKTVISTSPNNFSTDLSVSDTGISSDKIGVNDCEVDREKINSSNINDEVTMPKSETSSLTLAQRMKEMFDSSSPDQASNAFGKDTVRSSVTVSARMEDVDTDPPKAVSLAKNMKAMFDSFPNQPSNAFGNGTTNRPSVSIAKVESDISNDESRHFSSAKDMKEMFDSPSPDQPSKAFGMSKESVETAPSKPVSLAKNMKEIFDTPSQDEPSKAFVVGAKDGEAMKPVSMAKDRKAILGSPAPDKPFSAFATDKNPISFARDMKAMFDSPSPEAPSRAFGVGKAVPYKTKGGLTAIAKPQYDNNTMSAEQSNEKANEKKLVSPVSEAYQMVTLLWDSKRPVKQSPLTPIHPELHTFSEKVVDDKILNGIDDAVIRGTIIEEDEDEIEEITVYSEDGKHEDKITSNGDDGSYHERIAEVIIDVDCSKDCLSVTTEDDPIEGTTPTEVALDFETFGKEDTDECSYDEITIDDTEWDVNTSDRDELPKFEKHNPPMVGNRSTTGTITEKLKMFEIPKASSDEAHANFFKKPWQTSQPKPLVKSPTTTASEGSRVANEGFKKTHEIVPVLEPREKSVDRFSQKSSNKSGYSEKDKALVEEIIQLVQEPEAMLDKRSLAERITSLLTGKIKDKTSLSEPKMSLTRTHTQSIRRPPSITNYSAEANTGVPQIRKDVGKKKENLNHVDDSKTSPNRNKEHTNMKEREEEPIERLVADREKSKLEKETSVRSAFDKTQKTLSADEIIARIWPKTPEDKPKPKPFSTPSRAAKSLSFESPRKVPSKLGNRLNIFQTQRASGKPSPKKSLDTPKYVSSIDEALSKMSNHNFVAIENEVNYSSLQIRDKTVRGVLSFQRLWRARQKMLQRSSGSTVGDNTSFRQRKKVDFKKMSISQPDTSSPHGNRISGSAPSKPVNKSNSISHPIISSPENIPSHVSLSESGKRISTSAQSSCDSNEGNVGFRGCYTLEDLEQGRFDRNIFDMERWEAFLTDESFYEHFGLTKENFYQQPKWKRDNQKRKVRVAF